MPRVYNDNGYLTDEGQEIRRRFTDVVRPLLQEDFPPMEMLAMAIQVLEYQTDEVRWRRVNNIAPEVRHAPAVQPQLFHDDPVEDVIHAE